MKKQTGRRDARAGGRRDRDEKKNSFDRSRGDSRDKKPFTKRGEGGFEKKSFERRSDGDDRKSFVKRGEGRDENKRPYTKREETRRTYDDKAGPSQFKRYPGASKSEGGWTKPDGKPMRKRTPKDGEEPRRESRSFDKRPSGDRRSSEGKSFSGGRDNFRGDKKPFERRDDKPFGERRRDDKPFGERRRDDAPAFEKRNDRSERSFNKPEGDTGDFIRNGRGKGGFDRGEKSGFERKPRSYDKDRAPREEGSERKSFGRRDDGDDSRSFSRDNRSERSFGRRRDDDRSFDKRNDRTTGENGGKRYGKEKGRPAERNKSFLKSGVKDDKPFGRFSKKPGRDDRRSREAAPLVQKKRHIKKERSDYESAVDDGTIRLNRYISNAGICSRREADDYITAGLVSVNGEIVTELGTKVSLGDDVRYNGERLKAEKNVYLILNKPKDYITTSDDPDGRKTVMELVAKACKERIYPVGRLDRNTTGLLLFTNDGELAKKLTHPSTMVRKVYFVELDKSLRKADFDQLLSGVSLEDGVQAVDDISYDAGGDKSQVGVELHSGKNRIVRRLFEHLGYEVRKLDRVIFAGLTKKDLPRGRFRMLTEVEIASLKMQTGKAKDSKSPKGEKKERKPRTPKEESAEKKVRAPKKEKVEKAPKAAKKEKAPKKEKVPKEKKSKKTQVEIDQLKLF